MSSLSTGVLLLLSALPHAVQAADVRVSEVWARPTPPTAQVGAVYFSVSNQGKTDDELLGVSTDVAAKVEMHETVAVQGVMQMRQVTSVRCPVGVTVKIQPGGLHIMLLGLKHPLVDGGRIEVTLRFRDAGAVLLQVPVRNGL